VNFGLQESHEELIEKSNSLPKGHSSKYVCDPGGIMGSIFSLLYIFFILLNSNAVGPGPVLFCRSFRPPFYVSLIFFEFSEVFNSFDIVFPFSVRQIRLTYLPWRIN